MRVGIVTLPFHTNYGGILQSFALLSVLKRMGHEPEVLCSKRYTFRYYIIFPLAVIKRILKIIFLHKHISALKSPYQLHATETDKFIKRHIKIRKTGNWKRFPVNNYGAVISGSDQIWRPEYSVPIEHGFLDFTNESDILRISYAASFGTKECPLNHRQLEQCRPLLNKFKAVSVREHSGVDICRTEFNIKACQMPDPTLLLDKNDYVRLIQSGKTKPSNGELMTYILDETPEKSDFIERLAAENNMRISSFREKEDYLNENICLREKIHPSIEQWLRGFIEASFIITDSYHGCIFSIIFQKQFIAIGNEGRGLDRFHSLLNTFGLSNRLLTSIADFRPEMVKDDIIDYEKVSAILTQEKKRGIKFLQDNLI